MARFLYNLFTGFNIISTLSRICAIISENVGASVIKRALKFGLIGLAGALLMGCSKSAQSHKDVPNLLQPSGIDETQLETYLRSFFSDLNKPLYIDGELQDGNIFTAPTFPDEAIIIEPMSRFFTVTLASEALTDLRAISVEKLVEPVAAQPGKLTLNAFPTTAYIHNSLQIDEMLVCENEGRGYRLNFQGILMQAEAQMCAYGWGMGNLFVINLTGFETET